MTNPTVHASHARAIRGGGGAKGSVIVDQLAAHEKARPDPTGGRRSSVGNDAAEIDTMKPAMIDEIDRRA
ncbi:hypothetical protein [Caulifigura coniformis]|uniref:hypothetical protein n=1 Tax=Caulifigura coniformis TaxID=2527983 RepID=UPI0011A5F847|nr:hypothetical protein [Caulifigura coniformis]